MRFLTVLVKAFLAVLAVLAVSDLVVRASVPHFSRLQDNFSAAYLTRELDDARLSGKTVFAGDSVLWGYGLPSKDAALSRLVAEGLPVENLSFEGGSTVNTYALLRLMQSRGVRPRAVVFNVNLKEFNAADSAYQTLYPALERLTWPLLSADERNLLKATQRASFDQQADRALSSVWALYGMRSDVREALFGDADAASALKATVNGLSGEALRARALHRPTPEKFLGTYDLTPLDEKNVEVVFLRKIVRLLEAQHIPGYAVLTPQNHALLHDYIDAPEYDAQLAYVAKAASGPGMRVVNLDRAFRGADFLDNDHLTAAANVRFAGMLRALAAR